MGSDASTGGFRRDHFIAGDSMRGIAALWVVFAHLGFASVYGSVAEPSQTLRPELGELGPWVRHSHLAPLFFFTLSGYLIAQPFLGALVTGRRLPSIRRYAVRRWWRIVPAFWVVFALTVAVHGTYGLPVHEVLAIPLFAQIYFESPLQDRLVQAWTIDVEVIFYALMPLLAIAGARLIGGRWTPERRAAAICAVLIVLAVASLALKILSENNTTFFHFVAYAFVPGMIFATLEPVLRPRMSGTGGRRAATAVAAAAIVLLFTYTYTFGGAEDVWWRAPLGFVTCGALLAAPVTWQWATGGASRLFTNRPLQWVGERAYSIYLIHLLIMSQLRFLREGAGPLEGLALTAPPVFALSLLAAMPLYRYVEVPFMERRFPWARHRRPEPAAAEPSPSPAAP